MMMIEDLCKADLNFQTFLFQISVISIQLTTKVTKVLILILQMYYLGSVEK